MKAMLMFILICVEIFASQYSIGESKLIDGNTLVFESEDLQQKINIKVEDKKMILQEGVNNISTKLRNFSNFFRNIYTPKKLLNKMAKVDFEQLDNKHIMLGVGSEIYNGYIKVVHTEEDTIFDSEVAVDKISFVATQKLDLNSFDTQKLYEKTVLFLSKDRNGNIYSFGVLDKSYKLSYVTNNSLKNFLSKRKELIKSLDISKSPVTIKYIANKDNNIIIREVVYEKTKDEHDVDTILATIKDIDRDTEREKLSHAKLYKIKINSQNVLFENKGNAKVNSKQIYSFFQHPAKNFLIMHSNNSKSKYYIQGIYYYNKAGVWYLLSWLKQNNIDSKKAYVFDGYTEASIFNITQTDKNRYSINNKTKVDFFENSPLIKKYGSYEFLDIENKELKNLKNRFNIVEIKQ